MAASKKDFIALADAIKEHNRIASNRINAHMTHPSHEPFTANHLETIADCLKMKNPRFNRERWLGYIEGTNGKNGGTPRK